MTTDDCIHIQGLNLKAQIGAYRWEHFIRRSVCFDITLGHSITAAGQSDDLADALDYAQVVAELEQLLNEKRFQLLECLAETVAQYLLKQYPIEWVTLSVSKKGFAKQPQMRIGLSITRRR